MFEQLMSRPYEASQQVTSMFAHVSYVVNCSLVLNHLSWVCSELQLTSETETSHVPYGDTLLIYTMSTLYKVQVYVQVLLMVGKHQLFKSEIGAQVAE